MPRSTKKIKKRTSRAVVNQNNNLQTERNIKHSEWSSRILFLLSIASSYFFLWAWCFLYRLDGKSKYVYEYDIKDFNDDD